MLLKGGPCISLGIIFHKCPKNHLNWHAIAVTDPFVGKTIKKIWNTTKLKGHLKDLKLHQQLYSSSKKITQVEVGSLWDTFYFFPLKSMNVIGALLLLLKIFSVGGGRPLYLRESYVIQIGWFFIIIAIMVPALTNIIILKPTQWIEVSQENLSPHFSFWRQARNLDEKFSESKC